MINARNFWFWFGGIWLFCGLPVLVAGLYHAAQHRQISSRLDADGLTVQGMVLTKAITSSSSGSSRQNRTPTYNVTFRFTTSGGPVTGEAEVTSDAWDALVEREPIRVTYVPDAPQHYRVQGQTSGWVSPVLMAVMGGIFTSLGGFVFVRARIHLQTAARIRRDGITTEATIVEVRPARVVIDGERQWSLRYRYRDERGASHTGTESLSPEDAEAWKEGEKGMIRYDRHRPGFSIWIGRP